MPAIINEVTKMSSARKVICGLRRDLYARRCLTVLKAFIDDSGSGGDSRWFILAGYVGTVEGWDLFGPQWQAVLDARPRIEYLKSSEAESLRPEGQWAGITQEQRNAKLDAFIKVIQRCARRAIAIRMKPKDYETVIRGNVPPMWDNPYYFLFMSFITAATSIENLIFDDEPTEFIFDTQRGVEKRSEMLYYQMIEQSRFAGRIVNVLYRDEKEFLPLQAADLLAWQVRRAYCVTDETRRRHFDAALHCVDKSFMYTITKENLKEYLVNMVARVRSE